MAHDVHRPPAVVLAPGGDQLAHEDSDPSRWVREAARRNADEPFAVHAGLLEALVAREAVHPGGERVDDLVGASSRFSRTVATSAA